MKTQVLPRVVFDLDDTIALTEHRKHHILRESQDWDAFFRDCPDDVPNWPVIRTLQAYQRAGYPIWIFTGRNEMVWEETIDWLTRHGVTPDLLEMRTRPDRTNDDELKARWADHYQLTPDNTLAVFEDRDRVVQMWRDRGMVCFQVQPGAF